MRPRTFTDEDLLETAKAIFLEHGAGVSTARIAEAMGVSQAALFKRFSTKKKLMIHALMPQGEPRWIERISEGPNEDPVPDQLLEIVTEMDSFFSRMMPAMSVIRAAGIQPACLLEAFTDEPLPCRTHHALTQFFETLNAQGRAKVPEPRAAAMAFMGAVHSRHSLTHMLGDRAPDGGEDYAERMVEFFWAGLEPD